MYRYRVLLLLLAVGLAVLSACAPATPIRRTALIPPPTTPSRSGAPLEEGQFNIAFEVSSIELGTYTVGIAEVNSPGVIIPRFNLGGSFYYGISNTVELGAKLQYTNASWGHVNSFGVLPLYTRDNTRSLWLGGPGLRLNFPFHKSTTHGASISLMGELNFASVPHTTYVCETCTDGTFIPDYDLASWDREMFTLPNLAAQFGYRFNDFFYLSAVLGAQSTVTNNGFDPNILTLNESTLEHLWLGYVGIGGEVIFEPFFTQIQFYYPFEGEEHIDFGFRMTVQVGVRF